MNTRLLKILEKVKGKRILVWGDLVCDKYIYGDVSRISREAPVLVLKKTGSEYRPGGAANAANNLISLGAEVKLMGILGKDENGNKLLSLFKHKVLKPHFGFKSFYLLVEYLNSKGGVSCGRYPPPKLPDACAHCRHVSNGRTYLCYRNSRNFAKTFACRKFLACREFSHWPGTL